MALPRSNKRIVRKQVACQFFVIKLSEGDHHDPCSEIMGFRTNLLAQAHMQHGLLWLGDRIVGVALRLNEAARI